MILSRSSSCLGVNSVERGLAVRPNLANSSSTSRRSRTTLVRATQSDPVNVGVWFSNLMEKLRGTTSSSPTEDILEEKRPLQGAVLLFGSTGKTGLVLLQKLLDSGRVVKAAVRSGQAIKEKGIEGDGLYLVEGVDMKDPATLNAELFEGVSQVVLCTGPVLLPNPAGEGPPIVSENDTPENVDKKGVINVVKACEEFLPKSEGITLGDGFDLADQLDSWESISDAANGGQSSSSAGKLEGDEILIEGQVVSDGNDKFGFVQHRSSVLKFDLTDAYGVNFRVKGDGKAYFLCFKTQEEAKQEETLTYVAPFRTIDNEWTDVYIPLHEFLEVNQMVIPSVPRRLKPSTITKIGFLASRFGLNLFPNKNFKMGEFSLTIGSKFYPYSAAKPQIVFLSSAAVERNARIGSDKEAREKDIPIVRMNPKGILGYKYDGENAIRTSSLPYTIVRPNALIGELPQAEELSPSLLQFSQGDCIIGRIERREVADVMLQCTQRPEAAFKTFEVRRGLGQEAQNKEMNEDQYLTSFLGLVKDEERVRSGLPPFPRSVTGADQVDLTDDLVQDVVQQQRRVRSEVRDDVKVT